MTIKRRKFPKVLPDHPGREALNHKRRSMPAHGLFLPIPESSSFSQPNSPTNKSFTKLPPTPPPRTTTLQKQSSIPFVYLSEPILAEEPFTPEPEVVCNNLYVGPLIPKEKSVSKGEELNTQPIYSSLRDNKQIDNKDNKAKTVITTNSNTPIKRADPKIIVRPTLSRRGSDEKPVKHPRVVVPDNQPHFYEPLKPGISTKENTGTVANVKNGNMEENINKNNLLDETNLKIIKAKKIPYPNSFKGRCQYN
ncbi:hypothetical protein NQ317_007801 [Molorchus minor]|uniref:Uncharacterized protein n=1 Tax=Molorchus minor TaxID=1323400 RepID=A0ABQ9JHC6_9CUCU|nr:hypothetical protein NQ317_007801 [Molorchus minor]